MVNRHQPHVFVLPEDYANSQLANGFLLHQSVLAARIQILPEVGGWAQVLGRFESDHVVGMNQYPGRFMVLVFDFDGSQQRLEYARARIPAHLTQRVFLLGALSEPEDLRRAKLGTYEAIGKLMAEDCRAGTNVMWGHCLLQHNAMEIDRLREHVRPILFP